jgi:hypothetical protein
MQQRAWQRIGIAITLASLWPFGAGAEPAMKTYPPLPVGANAGSLSDWLRTHTDIQPASVVYVADGILMLLVERRRLPTGGAHSYDIVIRREAFDDNAAAVLKGRSDLVRIKLDCDTAQYRVLGARVYSANALSGGVQSIAPGAGEGTVRPGSDLALLMRASCNPAYKPPLPHRADHATAQVAAAPLQGPVRAGGYLVQVASTNSQAAARRSLEEVVRQAPEARDRPVRVEPAVVGGRTVYRAALGGFASRAQATAFCERLKSADHACLVR